MLDDTYQPPACLNLFWVCQQNSNNVLGSFKLMSTIEKAYLIYYRPDMLRDLEDQSHVVFTVVKIIHSLHDRLWCDLNLQFFTGSMQDRTR